MSDTFYERQARGDAFNKSPVPKGKTKQPRKLKKEWIDEITTALDDRVVVGLDKCTINTLKDLLEAIDHVKTLHLH